MAGMVMKQVWDGTPAPVGFISRAAALLVNSLILNLSAEAPSFPAASPFWEFSANYYCTFHNNPFLPDSIWPVEAWMQGFYERLLVTEITCASAPSEFVLLFDSFVLVSRWAQSAGLIDATHQTTCTWALFQDLQKNLQKNINLPHGCTKLGCQCAQRCCRSMEFRWKRQDWALCVCCSNRKNFTVSVVLQLSCAVPSGQVFWLPSLLIQNQETEMLFFQHSPHLDFSWQDMCSTVPLWISERSKTGTETVVGHSQHYHRPRQKDKWKSRMHRQPAPTNKNSTAKDEQISQLIHDVLSESLSKAGNLHWFQQQKQGLDFRFWLSKYRSQLWSEDSMPNHRSCRQSSSGLCLNACRTELFSFNPSDGMGVCQWAFLYDCNAGRGSRRFWIIIVCRFWLPWTITGWTVEWITMKSKQALSTWGQDGNFDVKHHCKIDTGGLALPSRLLPLAHIWRWNWSVDCWLICQQVRLLSKLLKFSAELKTIGDLWTRTDWRNFSWAVNVMKVCQTHRSGRWISRHATRHRPTWESWSTDVQHKRSHSFFNYYLKTEPYETSKTGKVCKTANGARQAGSEAVAGSPLNDMREPAASRREKLLMVVVLASLPYFASSSTVWIPPPPSWSLAFFASFASIEQQRSKAWIRCRHCTFLFYVYAWHTFF